MRFSMTDKLRTKRSGKSLRSDPAAAHFRIEHSPFFLMNRALSVYARAMERALKRVGADVPRWRVLMLTAERGPISIGHLAQQAGLKLSTTTKVAQRLRGEGLLRLRTSRVDARVTEALITSAGRKAASKVRAVASEMFRVGFAGLPQKHIESLNARLRTLESNLQSLL
jgi:DNA-binding MarR family transcriptional regulator